MYEPTPEERAAFKAYFIEVMRDHIALRLKFTLTNMGWRNV